MADAETGGNPDWDTLRDLELEEIRDAAIRTESPRYLLMLALLEIEQDVVVASSHLDKALALSESPSDEAYLAAMLKCSFSELLGSPFTRSECFERGDLIENIAHPWPAAIGQLHFGIWLAINGQPEAALRANRLAEKFALAAGDISLAATTQNNQGVDYLTRGLPTQAMKKFLAALELLQDPSVSDQESFLSLLGSNIASTHMELGDYETANTLLQSTIHSEYYDRYSPANLIDEVILARAALALGRPQEGYDRLSDVLQAIGPHGVTGNQAYAHSVIGELRMALGSANAGIQSFELAQDYAKRSGDPLQVNKVDVRFADALIGLGRYAQAETILDANIEVLEAHGPSMILAQALDLRGDLFRATDRRLAANLVKRQARQMQTSVAGAEAELDLAVLEKSLALARKDNELATAQREAQEKEIRANNDIMLRNLLIAMAVLLAFIAYLGLSRRYARKVAKTIRTANAELEAKVRERTASLEQEMAQRMEAESERQALAQSLAESEKLQAIGQLTSGVAHDFNNLMTVVTISAGMLRDADNAGDVSSARHLDNILAAAESASDITASLLAYARKQPLAPQPTNLKSFVADSQNLFESTLSEGMTLETNVASCSILVDRGQLTTAIINLLLNAKEALGSQGTVVLEAAQYEQTGEQGEIEPWVKISVSDDGQGMTADEMKRATEPFYSTKSERHGTGLGLSMVDGFSKQSGGSLEIESAKGVGTVVTLLIPSFESTALQEMTGEDETRDPLNEGLVMVVDDQEAIREVICLLLEKMGQKTISVDSGAEALQVLEGPQRPSLVITDLMMPGELSGQGLAAEIRRRYEDLPVLMMSGYTDAAGLDVEFLSKPFSVDKLREAINRVMGQKQVA
ncbi:MAG: ATP-binding protein [Pseudomonadaceae bacterium]|nr:ATP-binding protein [Pseudomonadaceae bacterium]